ncbi:MAG TPA: molybdenum cofactor guanylyltransferase [Spirochaetes bacterium]|nr:molybdenum cofactor guanylyltransferase [Spirochaetota bacterium]
MSQVDRRKVLGLVMCGGKSRRMGEDKGLIEINGHTWSQHVYNVLSPLAHQTVISIHPRQKEAYNEIFSPDQLIPDCVGVAGPLAGLLSVHKAYPDNDLLVLACDMIYMSSEVMEKLLAVYQVDPSFDIYVFRSERGLEPLSGLYTCKGLAKAYNDIIQSPNTLKDYSLAHLLSLGTLKELRVDAGDRKAFINLNYKDDI